MNKKQVSNTFTLLSETRVEDGTCFVDANNGDTSTTWYFVLRKLSGSYFVSTILHSVVKYLILSQFTIP